MSSAICPACDTLSFISPRQGKGQFVCPGCGRLLKYTVLGPGAAAAQTELHVPPPEVLPPEDVPRPRRLQPGTKFALALIVAALLGLGTAAGIAAMVARTADPEALTDGSASRVTADELLRDWQRYQGQRVRVTGPFAYTFLGGDRPNETLHVLLGPSREDLRTECICDPHDRGDFEGAKGQVTLEGVVTDKSDGRIVLRRCKRILP